MKNVISRFLLAIILIISKIECIEFYFTLEKFSHKCIGEYITEQTTGI